MTRLRHQLIDLRQRLEYAALRLVFASIRLLPVDRAAEICAWFWARLGPLLARHRNERALANLAIAFPEMPARVRARIAREHWANLGRVMAETMQLDRLIVAADRFEFADPEAIVGRPSDLGPTVAATLHMGNWELVSWPLSTRGFRPAAVYRRVDNPYIDRFLRAQRQTFYTGGLWGRGKGTEGGSRMRETAARHLVEHLLAGGVLGTVADLYDRKGVVVPFFGKPAPSFKGPAQLARTTGSRMLVCRCIRVGPGSRFRIEVHEIRYGATENPSDDVRSITAEIQSWFETWIRDRPEQWMWSNRRWS